MLGTPENGPKAVRLKVNDVLCPYELRDVDVIQQRQSALHALEPHFHARGPSDGDTNFKYKLKYDTS